MNKQVQAAGQPAHVFSQAPFLVYWETTRACDLACIHCRAEAINRRHPDELTTAEGRGLLQMVRDFGERAPQVVITGGDPMRRPDLWELISYGRSIGVPIALAPSVTPNLTGAALRQIRDLGVKTISISLDGAVAETHDGVRGIPGTFNRTLEAIADARAADLEVQINTLVTADTYPELPAIYQVLQGLDIMRWSLFFLISVGRGGVLRQIHEDEAEALCHWIADLMGTAPFEVKATEAPHFRRVAIQKMLAQGLRMADIKKLPLGRGLGVRDGNGILFVSHTGDVYPSGFLPVTAGNVRQTPLVEIYRSSPLFVAMRDVDHYKGKCGRCQFRAFCGGSRARAYVATGDPLGSDPLCAYQPPSGRQVALRTEA